VEDKQVLQPSLSEGWVLIALTILFSLSFLLFGIPLLSQHGSELDTGHNYVWMRGLDSVEKEKLYLYQLSIYMNMYLYAYAQVSTVCSWDIKSAETVNGMCNLKFAQIQK